MLPRARCAWPNASSPGGVAERMRTLLALVFAFCSASLAGAADVGFDIFSGIYVGGGLAIGLN